MLIYDVIRAAIPEADDNLCEWILWERTPFPFTLTVRGLWTVSWRMKRVFDKGLKLCELCDRLAEEDNSLCKPCSKHFKERAHETHSG